MHELKNVGGDSFIKLSFIIISQVTLSEQGTYITAPSFSVGCNLIEVPVFHGKNDSIEIL